MTTVTIYTDYSISVDGERTGYHVAVSGRSPIVRATRGATRRRDLGDEVRMPAQAHQLSSEVGTAEFRSAFARLWADAAPAA